MGFHLACSLTSFSCAATTSGSGTWHADSTLDERVGKEMRGSSLTKTHTSPECLLESSPRLFTHAASLLVNLRRSDHLTVLHCESQLGTSAESMTATHRPFSAREVASFLTLLASRFTWPARTITIVDCTPHAMRSGLPGGCRFMICSSPAAPSTSPTGPASE